MSRDSEVSLNCQVGGSISAQTSVYIEREADVDLLDGLKSGELCYVFNSRQMGKSSLLVHTKMHLESDGYLCCFLDMSRIGSVNVTTEQWFAGIISELWRGFKLPAGSAMIDWWKSLGDVSPAKKLGDFFQNQLLSAYPTQRCVVFFDEIDAVLSLPFHGHDFFSVIRAMFNLRAVNEDVRRLGLRFLVLPYPLI